MVGVGDSGSSAIFAQHLRQGRSRSLEVVGGICTGFVRALLWFSVVMSPRSTSHFSFSTTTTGFEWMVESRNQWWRRLLSGLLFPLAASMVFFTCKFDHLCPGHALLLFRRRSQGCSEPSSPSYGSSVVSMGVMAARHLFVTVLYCIVRSHGLQSSWRFMDTQSSEILYSATGSKGGDHCFDCRLLVFLGIISRMFSTLA